MIKRDELIELIDDLYDAKDWNESFGVRDIEIDRELIEAENKLKEIQYNDL